MKNVVRFLVVAAVIVVGSPVPGRAVAATIPLVAGASAQSYAQGVYDAQVWRNSHPDTQMSSRIVYAQTKCNQYTNDPNDGVRMYDPELYDYWNGYLAGLVGEEV